MVPPTTRISGMTSIRFRPGKRLTANLVLSITSVDGSIPQSAPRYFQANSLTESLRYDSDILAFLEVQSGNRHQRENTIQSCWI